MSLPTHWRKGPKVNAKYIQRAICPCGEPALCEDVPLGTIYQVYPESVRLLIYGCGKCGERRWTKCILAEERSGTVGFIPLDLLELPETKPS